jgi:MSHA biogenesis protein MshQ
MAKSVHGGGAGRVQMGIFSEFGLLYGRAETNSGRQNVFTALPIPDNWCHVAVVFDTVSLSIYINGALANSVTFSSTTLLQNTDPINISKRVGTSAYYFDGLIDDVWVYTRALNAAEILALYNMGN